MASKCIEPLPEGATLSRIVNYVIEKTRMTEPSARHAVLEVLNLGITMGRIGRTSAGTYLLMTSKPAAVIHRIREPRFDDDSSEESSTIDYSD